jgi:hypothetical protein
MVFIPVFSFLAKKIIKGPVLVKPYHHNFNITDAGHLYSG